MPDQERLIGLCPDYRADCWGEMNCADTCARTFLLPFLEQPDTDNSFLQVSTELNMQV